MHKGIFSCCVVSWIHASVLSFVTSRVQIVAFNARIDEQGPHSKISPLKSRAYFSEGFRFAVIGRFSNRSGTSDDDGRARGTFLILLQFDHICVLELREPLSSDVPDLLLTHSRLGSWSYLFSWTNIAAMKSRGNDSPHSTCCPLARQQLALQVNSTKKIEDS